MELNVFQIPLIHVHSYLIFWEISQLKSPGAFVDSTVQQPREYGYATWPIASDCELHF